MSSMTYKNTKGFTFTHSKTSEWMMAVCGMQPIIFGLLTKYECGFPERISRSLLSGQSLNMTSKRLFHAPITLCDTFQFVFEFSCTYKPQWFLQFNPSLRFFNHFEWGVLNDVVSNICFTLYSIKLNWWRTILCTHIIKLLHLLMLLVVS